MADNLKVSGNSLDAMSNIISLSYIEIGLDVTLRDIETQASFLKGKHCMTHSVY